jgi:cell division protein FtsW (lipid II flippase)
MSATIDDTAPRMNSGLGLLILAILISLLAYVLAFLGLEGKLPDQLPVYAALYVGGSVGAWLVIRWTARGADPVLFPIAAVLGGLGLALMYRIYVGRGLLGCEECPPFADEQAVWLLVGVAVFIATLLLIRDDRQLDGFTYTIGLAGLVLLLLPIVPGIGFEENGARLWVNLGTLRFQPAEFGRILIVIFLASYLSTKRELLAEGVGRLGLPRVKDMGPLMLAWGASLAVLFLERDMGASFLLFGVFVVMVWVASGRISYLVIGLVLFAIGATIGYLAFSHVQARVDFWLHALEPATVHDEGFGQLAQSWFALATGGLVGAGFGQGSPTLIPIVASDFAFSAIGEELGMLGGAGLLLVYLALIGRGLRIALERMDGFGKLLAVGLTTVLALQVFVIVGGVTRLIPLTGVPLPLVSYGGTSRVATFVMLALLVRISAGPWQRRTV